MKKPAAVVAASLLLFAAEAGAQGSTYTSSAELAGHAEDLAPGEWVWAPEVSPAGPVLVYVDLSRQLATVYRNGVRIAVSTVSSGKPGHATPTGVFTILQKDADHYSSIYNNASMPFTQRLTWSGIALHAGGLPGYPESHGCVHLPFEFARLLFEITEMGGTVIVAGEAGGPALTNSAGVLAAGIDGRTAPARPGVDLRSFEWSPGVADEGPVTIVMSLADSEIVVLRNGSEIGRAAASFPQTDFATHALTLTRDATGRDHWIFVGVPGHQNEAGRVLDASVAERVEMPAGFRRALAGILEPGATVLVTPSPVTEETTGRQMTIISGVEEAGENDESSAAPETGTDRRELP